MKGYIRIGPFVLLHKKILNPIWNAVGSALAIGEIHFETSILASGAKYKLQNAKAILDRLIGWKSRQ